MYLDRTMTNQAYLGKIKKDDNLKECAAYILEELAPLGIYITQVSRFSSTYFKFADSRLGSLRMADHKGRREYDFRWNLYTRSWEQKETKHKTHWYHIDAANEFIARVMQYAATIQRIDYDALPHSSYDIDMSNLPDRELPPLSAYEFSNR